MFKINKNRTYLNAAYLTPQPKKVKKAGIKMLNKLDYPYKLTANYFFEPSDKLRALFAELIHCKQPENIAVIPSVSYGITNAAQNIPCDKSHNIVLAGGQFPSNYYPWFALHRKTKCTLTIVDEPKEWKNKCADWNEAILNAINDKTAAIALPIVHWSHGIKFNIEAISKKAKKHGALLIIDGTQSIGALPFDVNKVKPDALICAGYKWLLGSYGIALAYYSDAFKNALPIEENWMTRSNALDFANLSNYVTEMRPLGQRLSAGGHSNHIHVAMEIAALKTVIKIKPENIQSHCKKISKKAIAKLRKNGFNILSHPETGAHLFGIFLNNKADTKKYKAKLDAAKIIVSQRGNVLRISPHIYNTEADFDKLAHVLLS